MNKYNLRILKRAGSITSSIALATTFAAVMPAIANADENTNETPTTIDTYSNEKDVRTDTKADFSGSYDTKEEAEAVKNSKEQEFKDAGYDKVKGDITEKTNTTKEEFEGTYGTKEEAEGALKDFADSVGGSVTDSTVTEIKKEQEKLYEEKEEIIEGTVEDYVKKLEEKVNELNKSGNYRLEISDPKTVKKDETVLIVTGVDEGTKIFGTKEEALKYIESLGNSTEFRLVKTNLSEVERLEDTIKMSLDKNFTTKQEALDYIESLKIQGYDVTATVSDVITSGILNEKYDTKEDAKKALNEFLKNYTNVTSSSVDKVRDESKDVSTTEKGDEAYVSEEDAKNAKESIEEETEDYKITVSIRKDTKEITSGEETISSKQFDTQEEAERYINDLLAQGYDVSDLDIELVSFEESTWKDKEGVEVDPGTADGKTFKYGHFDITLVTEFTKVDADGNETKVTGTIRISTVKINDKTIRMNGISRDPNTGKQEYTSSSRNNLDVTNKSLVDIVGTVSYGDTTLPFDVKGYLSESQNVCGGRGNSKGYDLEFKSVRIVNNKVLIDSNIVNQYKVVGTISKKENVDVWYLDKTTTTKGYSYEAKAEASNVTGYDVKGEAEKDVYTTDYVVDYEITNKEEKTVSKDATEIGYKIFEKTYETSYKIDGTVEITDKEYIVTVSGEKEKVIPTPTPDPTPDPEPEPEPVPDPEPTPDPEPEPTPDPEPEPEPEPMPTPDPTPGGDEDIIPEITPVEKVENAPVKTGDEMPIPAGELGLLGLGVAAAVRGRQLVKTRK